MNAYPLAAVRANRLNVSRTYRRGRLWPNDIARIRRWWAQRQALQAQLDALKTAEEMAREYGVSVAMFYRAANGSAYKSRSRE